MRTVKAFIFFVFSFSFAQGQVSLNEITGRQSKIYQLIKSQGKAYPFINIMSEEDTKTLKVYVPVKRFHSDIKNVVIVLSNGQAIVKMLSKIEVRQSEIAGSMLNVFHLQMNKFDIELLKENKVMLFQFQDFALELDPEIQAGIQNVLSK